MTELELKNILLSLDSKEFLQFREEQKDIKVTTPIGYIIITTK